MSSLLVAVIRVVGLVSFVSIVPVSLWFIYRRLRITTVTYTYAAAPSSVYGAEFEEGPKPASNISATLTFLERLAGNLVQYPIGAGGDPKILKPWAWTVDLGSAEPIRSDNQAFKDIPIDRNQNQVPARPLMNAGWLSTDSAGNITEWSLRFIELDTHGLNNEVAVLSSVGKEKDGVVVFDTVDIPHVFWATEARGAWTSPP